MNDNANSKKTVVPRDSVLDPRKPNLAQPFKRMVEEGMAEITVTFTSLGFQATGKPGQVLVDLPKSGLEIGKEYPIIKLLHLAEGAKLLERGKKSKTGGKAEQPLPAKTLCVRDFEGTTDQQLLNRAKAVANAANGGTLTGRAREAGSFRGTVTTTFQDWWVNATAHERATALCQKKDLAKLSDAHVKRLSGKMPCPFPGTASFLVSQDDSDDEDDEAEAKSSSKTNVEEAEERAAKTALSTASKSKTPSPTGSPSKESVSKPTSTK